MPDPNKTRPWVVTVTNMGSMNPSDDDAEVNEYADGTKSYTVRRPLGSTSDGFGDA